MDKPELETLSYKPKIASKDEHPEQPNQQLMLIQTMKGLTTCILNSITKLPASELKDQAYDDMNIFETGILFRLQKEYE